MHSTIELPFPAFFDFHPFAFTCSAGIEYVIIDCHSFTFQIDDNTIVNLYFSIWGWGEEHVLSFVQKQDEKTCYTFMTTFIATFHAWKKDDIATFAFFLFVSVFCMKW